MNDTSMDNIGKKARKGLSLSSKLLTVIIFFLFSLTLSLFVYTYFLEKSHLVTELKEKKHFLESIVIEQYQTLPEEEFLQYAERIYFIDSLKAVGVSSFLLLDSNDDIVFNNYSDYQASQIRNSLIDVENKNRMKREGAVSSFASAYFEKDPTYDYQIYIQKDGDYGGLLYASLDLKKYRSEMKKYFIFSLIISFVVFLFSMLIYIYSAKTITTPLQQFIDTSRKVSQGDFKIRVDLESDNELGSFAKTFNDMIERLDNFNTARLEQIDTLNETLMLKNAELESNYEEMEATNEELETTNEELIATNEELEIANRDLFAMAQELKKSKEDLEKNMDVVKTANEELIFINKMKTNFLGMASHELKTPLVMIKGYSELILDNKSEELEPSVREMVSHILKGADTLNSIIRDMLDITKIEANDLKLSCVPVELGLVIDTAISEMKSIADERKQELKISDMPKISVLVDTPQIHRVFTHLISNAIKFTPDKGKIQIFANIVKDEILTSMYESEGVTQAVDIVFSDSGIGIDKKEQQRIFDVFYEVGDIDHHRTSKSAYLGKGSGLGLPICRGIVEAHKGRMFVESDGVDLNAFKGSRFHVVLPFIQKEGEKFEVMGVISKETGESKKLKRRKPRVLLIEDEQEIVEITCLILEDLYTIEVARNGADGIKKVFSFKPDVILLDIYMKGLNGYEVCTILKGNVNSKNIPIAMFTAGTQKYEIEKGYQVGVDDYITKPFNANNLIAKIENLLKLKTGHS